MTNFSYKLLAVKIIICPGIYSLGLYLYERHPAIILP
jgi:hypothetical protein